MAWLKRMFTAIFNTEFLKKILLIFSIFAVLDYLDNGLRIDLDLNVRNSYGAFEVEIKE